MREKGNGIKTVLIAFLITLVVIGCAVLGVRHRIAKAHEEGYQQALEDAGIAPVTVDLGEGGTLESGTLLTAVQSAKELIAYKYHYESVADYQKEKKFFGTGISVPFTQDRSIFAYRGQISAGVDLKDLQISVDNQKQEISVFLPQPAVLAHEFEIDSFRIYDLKNSVFTTSNLEDYAGLESALKQIQEDRIAGDEEFWSDVRTNSELVLKDILTMTGKIEGYTVVFSWMN